MASAAAGQNRAFGIDRGLPFPVSDIAETEALLLVGLATAPTRMPPIMQWVDEQKSRGGKLIVVDPRRTDTARAADLHLQLTPGTDLALANGLLYLAIEERLIDRDVHRARAPTASTRCGAACSTLPPGARRAPDRRADRAAAAQAVRLARPRPRAAWCSSGRGAEQQSKGVDTVLAFINLMLALGKVGKPASGYGCLTGPGQRPGRPRARPEGRPASRATG